MMQKRMAIKGQEGMSMGALAALILVIVVVVIIIIGVTTGFDFIFGKIKLLPGQALETVAQSCGIAGEQQLKIDYCSFKKIKIDGKDEYLNCEDGRIQTVLKAEAKGKVSCAQNSTNVQCTSLAQNLPGEKGKKDCSQLPKVNGNDCVEQKLIVEGVCAPQA